jgi:predicted DNA-binding helix-hairpin-helix protein
VPGASSAPGERVFFEPFVWANTPVPNSATKAPTRQNTDAIKTRRLKNADFEVDFFFMNEVELFRSPVNPEMEPKSYLIERNLVNDYFTSA